MCKKLKSFTLCSYRAQEWNFQVINESSRKTFMFTALFAHSLSSCCMTVFFLLAIDPLNKVVRLTPNWCTWRSKFQSNNTNGNKTHTMGLLQWGHMSHTKQFLVVKNLMLQGKPSDCNVEQVVSIECPILQLRIHNKEQLFTLSGLKHLMIFMLFERPQLHQFESTSTKSRWSKVLLGSVS
jgi:hypothetical protein